MTSYEILTTSDTLLCDRYAEKRGIDGLTLMEAAGRGIVAAIIRRWAPRPVLIACGPGNNGGDGFVCARLLQEAGWPVSVGLHGDALSLSGDAEEMARRWDGDIRAFIALEPVDGALVIDALFGAGLARPLDESLAGQLRALAEAASAVVAVDLPSGLSGDGIAGLQAPYLASLTVSFHTYKPAHLLEPGASQCGEVELVDIGIPSGWSDEIKPVSRLNHPDIWGRGLPQPASGAHKHARGRMIAFSGGAASTGAARLAAEAGLSAGAGLVTLASPPDALAENAAHLTAVMLRAWTAPYEAEQIIDQIQADACVIGPAAGLGAKTRQAVETVLTSRAACVLDADALSSFEGHARQLFEHLRPGDVLTPHLGEFRRIFPGIIEKAANKIEAVLQASQIAGCTVLLKGPDTVIAAPDQLPVVNRHATAWLATAGSGDVLAGLIAGLMAQGVPGYLAAQMGCWLHGEAARQLGPALGAEALCDQIRPVIAARLRAEERQSALEKLLLS
ncbi:MAG: NAD(P)H-hydrate dehydratase [Alphaproteobacteria bacterium]|nr:NAD(P)H-hydrate dehydratase [Alphaproteobacteria bacterium]